MNFRGRSANREDPEMNMVPMIDLLVSTIAFLLMTAVWVRPPALPVTVRSTIGAGDSFLGGWLHGWRQHDERARDSQEGIESAFRWAMATATSAVSSYGTALCDPQQVQQWLSQVKIERLQR